MNRLLLLAAIAVSIVSQAAELVIDVPSGGSTDLDAALSALTGYVTQPSREGLNGGAYAAYDIRKTGSGTLVFPKDKFLATWTGNLYVDAGIVEAQVNCQEPQYVNLLGKPENGGVYVAPNATLYVNTDKYSGYSGYTNTGIKRPISIAGTGVDGRGALLLYSNSEAGGGARATCPAQVRLTGDAMIGLNNCLVWEGKGVYLEGHKLTFTTDPSVAMQTLVDTLRMYGEGHVVFDRVIWGTRATSVTSWENPSGLNSVTFTNGAYFCFNNSDVSVVAQDWKFIYANSAAGTIASICSGTEKPSSKYSFFTNEVELLTDVRLELGNTTDSAAAAKTLCNGMSFFGRVTGSGGITFDGGDRTACNRPGYGNPFVRFFSGANAFTGPLTLSNTLLELYSGAAVPTASNVTLSNVVVRLQNPTDSQELGTVSFEGACAVENVPGTPDRRRPFAVNAGRLSVANGSLRVRADNFTAGGLRLRDGVLKLEREDYSGLLTGKSPQIFPGSDPYTCSTKKATELGYPDKNLRDVVPTLVYSNAVDNPPAIFYTPHGAGYQATSWEPLYYGRIVTYVGYLHNTTGSDLPVRLICTLNAYTHIKIGETTYDSAAPVRNQPEALLPTPGEPVMPPLDRNVTIPAGTSRFEIRLYDRYGRSPADTYSDGEYKGQYKPYCYGNVCTNGLVNWDDCHGLMWTTKTSSNDMNDYHPFADTGHGLSFTTVPGANTDWRIASLTGSGTLDLDGETLRVDSIDAGILVRNGKVEIGEACAFGSGLHAVAGTIADPRYVAGLWTGITVRQSTEGSTIAANLFKDKVVYHDTITRTLDYAYMTQTQIVTGPYKRYAYATYDGYIWNTGSETKKWTIASTHDGFTRVVVNDTTYESPYKWYSNWPDGGAGDDWKRGCQALWTDVELRPGANRFTVMMAAQYTGAPYVGHSAYTAEQNPGWTDAFGLAYDPQNRGVFAKANFQAFEDDGSGQLFTQELLDSEIRYHYAAMSGVKGTVLNLQRGVAIVDDFIGAALVSNGLIKVTGDCRMTAAQINDPETSLDGVEFVVGATFDVSDVAADVLPRTRGRLVARNVVGSVCPTLGEKLASDGWTIALQDGEVRVCKPSGLCIIVE